MSLTTPRADQTATRLARSASALMLLSAAISASWAAGGTGLLDTVGGSIARWGHAGGAGVKLALAAIVVLKLVAAWLPARAVRAPCPRAVRRLAGLEAAILTVYGGVLTGTGLVVQAGLVGGGPDADWKALDWHVYLWDPWFLVVGLLGWVALRRTRSDGPGAHGPRYGRGEQSIWTDIRRWHIVTPFGRRRHRVAPDLDDHLGAGPAASRPLGRRARLAEGRRPSPIYQTRGPRAARDP